MIAVSIDGHAGQEVAFTMNQSIGGQLIRRQKRLASPRPRRGPGGVPLRYFVGIAVNARTAIGPFSVVDAARDEVAFGIEEFDHVARFARKRRPMVSRNTQG